MKKFFIGMTACVLCLALAGCGENNGEMTINGLASQLDETSNIISSVQMVNPSDINLTKDMLETIATSENSAAIYDNVIGAQQTLLNEEYYKTDILARTSKLKNSLSKNLKLSKSQATAVKELTKNLEKYSNSVAYTQNDMSSTLRQISSLKKNVAKNSDKLNAKLNRLACNSNARSSYYENIILTLNQLETYLSAPQDALENPNQADTSQTPSTLQAETRICPNCNMASESEKCEFCGYDFCHDCENVTKEDASTDTQNENNIASISKDTNTSKNMPNNPYARFNSNNINRIAYPYGANGFGAGYGAGMYGANPYYGGFGGYGAAPFYGAYPYGNGGFGGYGAAPFYGAYPYGNGGFGGYGNGMYGAFGTPYANGGINGNNINFARFNPNRNTDTYAPLMRNIDTYRAGTQIAASSQTEQSQVPEKELSENNPALENKPEQRLENFEKVNEDNTIENLDEKQVEKDTQTKQISEQEDKMQNSNVQAEKEDKKEAKLLSSVMSLSPNKADEYDPPVVAH